MLMTMMPHQLLLLLVILCVVNLPSSWSSCDLSAARREAQTGLSRKMNPSAPLPRIIARRAAKQARVKVGHVEEAYHLQEHSRTCILFSAWSHDCVSHLMYCVASGSFIHRRIDVDCVPVYLVEMSVKSGGEVYLHGGTNTPVVAVDSDIKDADDKYLMLVTCRLWHNVTIEIRESKEKFCVSIVDPARPAWFVRHYGYYLYLEPEYNPRNPHIFDDDASFLLTPDKFFPEYFVLESVNYPNHYIQVTSDGRMKITKYVHTQEFQNSASFALTDHFVKPNYPCSSCKEIHDLNYMYSPSGEYPIKTSTGLLMEKVYCEMGLNGGGYTFINPKYLTMLCNDDLQAMFSDKNSFLMRVRLTDFTQPYGLLEQLPQYQDVPLKLGLNEYTNYTAPQNLNYLGPHFTYFGFIPASLANNPNEQGLRINGQNLTFTNCDANPNSYMVVFPNFAERQPTGYLLEEDFTFCDQMREALWLNPSSRVMPSEYFMFYETHWGGCGCYTQTDGRQTIGAILNVAIGFR